MFSMSGKIVADSHILFYETITDSSEDTRTHKVFGALEALCNKYDLEVPVWFNSNIDEFKRLRKTRFTRDNFIEHIFFDYFEIQITDED